MTKLLDHAEVLNRAAKIRNIILDIDGVLTDGKIHISTEKTETLSFYVRDGLGMVEAMKFGLEFWIITGRDSQAVTHRMEDLKVRNLYKGVLNKVGKFEELLKEGRLTVDDTAYMGDDVIDLPLLKRVGLSTSVADAHEEVLENVHWVSSKNGGQGAVRELIDLILSAQGKMIRY